jgi:methionine-S-sulfoxide reductase
MAKIGNKFETITLAGGCFWCTEAIFKRTRGVVTTMPGYSGGPVENPTYEEVRSGKTGHAEAIQIEFDPKIISLETLLWVFFKLHNPTTVNRQSVDIGTQYRSVIFYRNEKQNDVALRVKAEIDKSGLYKNKVVTKIEKFKNFYNAEDYHQNYYDDNKNALYCRLIIDPKIKKLLKNFGDLVKQ